MAAKHIGAGHALTAPNKQISRWIIPSPAHRMHVTHSCKPLLFVVENILGVDTAPIPTNIVLLDPKNYFLSVVQLFEVHFSFFVYEVRDGYIGYIVSSCNRWHPLTTPPNRPPQDANPTPCTLRPGLRINVDPMQPPTMPATSASFAS